MTRDDMIDDLMTSNVHGYRRCDLERMSDYELRSTYDAYEDTMCDD